MRNAVNNVKWGVSGGLGIASFYCIWVIVVYTLAGAEAFTRQGVSLQAVIATYLVVGVSAGALIGLFRRWAENWFGAFVVGLAAGVPIAAGLMICINGWPTTWSHRTRHLFPMFSVVAGSAVGFLLNRRAEELAKSSDPEP
jgi:hypothetical protein